MKPIASSAIMASRPTAIVPSHLSRSIRTAQPPDPVPLRIKAKMFTGNSGGVTERNMAIEGQELREMTRDLDLLEVDVDSIAIVIRLRFAIGTDGRARRRGERRRARARRLLSCLVRPTRVHARHFILLNRTPLPSGRRVAM
jgi:hypothetical protein